MHAHAIGKQACAHLPVWIHFSSISVLPILLLESDVSIVSYQKLSHPGIAPLCCQLQCICNDTVNFFTLLPVLQLLRHITSSDYFIGGVLCSRIFLEQDISATIRICQVVVL